MNKTQLQRRREIVRELMQLYSNERLTLFSGDYIDLVRPKATELCQKALDDGVKLSKSKTDLVSQAAITVAYDAFKGGVFIW